MDKFGPLDTEKDGPRIIRCTIELDLVEGTHFNPNNKEISDEDALNSANRSFCDIVRDIADYWVHLYEYIQTKIVEDVS